ncbi:hypothetical protein BDV10DRAFT_130878 [Aspergillus recurvatus]
MFGDSDGPRERMLIGGGRSACFPGVGREGDEEEEGEEEEEERRIWVKLRLDRTRTPSKRLSIARNGTIWDAIGVCVRHARHRLKRDNDSGAQGIAQGHALVDHCLNKRLTVYLPQNTHSSLSRVEKQYPRDPQVEAGSLGDGGVRQSEQLEF